MTISLLTASSDHKICNVEHGTNGFQPVIITYPKIMPSPELKYCLKIREKCSLRTRNAMASKIPSAKVEHCWAWVNKLSSPCDQQTYDHTIISSSHRVKPTVHEATQNSFKPFERTSGINSTLVDEGFSRVVSGSYRCTEGKTSASQGNAFMSLHLKICQLWSLWQPFYLITSQLTSNWRVSLTDAASQFLWKLIPKIRLSLSYM